MKPLLAQLFPSVASAAKRVMKAQETDDAAEITAGAIADPDVRQKLVQTLTNLYGDSFLAGQHAAVQQGATKLTVGAKELVASIDWDAWKPGYPQGAAKVAGESLKSLLDQADVQIQGFSDTMLTRLGNALAQGLASGDSVGAISGSITDSIDGVASSQADLIAVTEVARAQTAGTIDAYNDSGITQFDLITEPDACQVCLDVESDNPHDVSEDDAQPPIHPRCRCAVLAVIPTGGTADPDDTDTGDGDS